ncbi:lipase family protein [Gordonia sp. NPDC003950]
MLRKWVVVLSVLLIGLIPFVGTPTASAAPQPTITAKPGAGTVISSTDITDQPDARMTGATKVIAVTYLSENAQGDLVPVKATVSIPETNPHGRYRIFAWAHGTAGLGDECTVTDRMGVRINGKERWHDWMGPWLSDGYVIVASEYAGVGGPGVHAYSDGQMQGKNVIDSVRAARTVVERYGDGNTAGTGYLTSGGSQGGQSAIFAGHLAPTYAPELRNVGVSAQSVPVDIAEMLAVVAPGVPPVAIPDYVTYVSYVLAGLKVSRPDIDVDSYLTPLGKRLVDQAATACYPEFSPATSQYNVGQMVSRPLSERPLLDAVRANSNVPDSGYEAPMLIQQGLLDPIAPAAFTSAWVDRARANGARIDYRTYPGATHGLGAYAETEAHKWADTLAWPTN